MQFCGSTQIFPGREGGMSKRAKRLIRSTPPRCLQGFDPVWVEPTEKVDSWSALAKWKLICPCGCSKGSIYGYSLVKMSDRWDGPLFFLSPLAFKCSDCGRCTEIIDTHVHGYDGEFERRSGKVNKITKRGSGAREVFQCHDCEQTEFTMEASFVFSHFDHIEDEPELGPYAMDFFDWFALKATCASCKHEMSVGSYELA